MLFQPSNISPDEITETGCIDTTENMQVTWQVNGDSAMTAYQIDIYDNDAVSTLKFSTGKKTLTEPFWGINFRGETQYFSTEIMADALASANIINGGEYKMLITQWWNTGSIKQTTASVFIGRAAPTLSINTIPTPVTGRKQSFTAEYSQAQGDSIKWVQWEIAERGKEAEPFLDTGRITGTGELRVEYDGFYAQTDYSIRCRIETVNGIQAGTEWTPFRVEYAVAPPQGNVKACQLANDSAVYVRWDRMELAQSYSVLRQRVGEKVLHKVADVDGTTGQLRDYGAASGQSYIYYVFPVGELAYLTQPMVSEAVNVQLWFWSIIEAVETAKNIYTAKASYLFKMGRGGVQEGSFSNNNKPSLLKTFARYPTRQGESANYLSGSVSGYIGKFVPSTAEYSDTVEQSDRLMDISTSKNKFFLLDPKGHFLQIHTNSPLSLSINHKNTIMPQTVSINWTELGSTEGVSLYSAPGGDFFPSDAVIGTRFSVNPQTGALIWSIPDGYDNGSKMGMNERGELIQNTDGAFTAAEMTLDKATMEVSASIE